MRAIASLNQRNEKKKSMVEQVSYLGYSIQVSDRGFLVNAGGLKVRFQSMAKLRLYVRVLRREGVEA